jgi:hypothetical protein
MNVTRTSTHPELRTRCLDPVFSYIFNYISYFTNYYDRSTDRNLHGIADQQIAALRCIESSQYQIIGSQKYIKAPPADFKTQQHWYPRGLQPAVTALTLSTQAELLHPN